MGDGVGGVAVAVGVGVVVLVTGVGEMGGVMGEEASGEVGQTDETWAAIREALVDGEFHTIHVNFDHGVERAYVDGKQVFGPPVERDGMTWDAFGDGVITYNGDDNDDPPEMTR